MSDAAPAAPTAPAAPPPGAQPAATTPKPGETPAQAEARRIKLVLDGKEEDLGEEEVVANYRKGKNAAQLLSKVDQRRQEALKAQAHADGVLGRLKKEPLAVLRELGVDVRQLSESTILQEIELERMTPAERKAHELEQKLKGYESEKQKAEEERKRAAFEEEKARHQDEFAQLFTETMVATGLPKTSARHVAHRMAALYQQNEEAGLESTPEEMAAHVMHGLKAEHTGLLSGMEGDALLEWLGEGVVKKVLGAHLAKVRSRPGAQPAVVRAPMPAPAASPVDPRKGRWADIDRLIKGG